MPSSSPFDPGIVWRPAVLLLALLGLWACGSGVPFIEGGPADTEGPNARPEEVAPVAGAANGQSPIRSRT
jgi:hypothetical protein